eukprot:SAG25_NODE_845_length_5085_cov_16.777978_12_plen_33_part_00
MSDSKGVLCVAVLPDVIIIIGLRSEPDHNGTI